MKGVYCLGMERWDGNIEEYEGKQGMKDEGIQKEERLQWMKGKGGGKGSGGGAAEGGRFGKEGRGT